MDFHGLVIFKFKSIGNEKKQVGEAVGFIVSRFIIQLFREVVKIKSFVVFV